MSVNAHDYNNSYTTKVFIPMSYDVTLMGLPYDKQQEICERYQREAKKEGILAGTVPISGVGGEYRPLDSSRKPDDENIPITLVFERLEGKHPLIVWLDYRNMTFDKLVEKSGVDLNTCLAIATRRAYENPGDRRKREMALPKLAHALNVYPQQLGTVK